MTPEKAIEVAIALHPITRNGQAEPLTAAVLAALAEQDLVIVDREDLTEAVDALAGTSDYTCGSVDCWNEVCERTARLRAILSGTAPQPSGTLQDVRLARDGMSGRSDDASPTETLSGLREELRRTVLRRNAANAMRGVHEHRATRLKTELDHAKAALAGENEAISLFMADCTKAAERLREQVNLWQKAAEQAEAKLDRLREPHTRGPRTNTCNDCGQDWPCETIQTIDEEKPHA